MNRPATSTPKPPCRSLNCWRTDPARQDRHLRHPRPRPGGPRYAIASTCWMAASSAILANCGWLQMEASRSLTMRALNKKAIKDLTRRKPRTILTVLGIAVGIMGLSAINMATDQFTIACTTPSTRRRSPMSSSSPRRQIPCRSLGAPGTRMSKSRKQDFVPTRWKIPSGHPLNHRAWLTFQDCVQFNTFQLLDGALPQGPNQIVLESSDLRRRQRGQPIKLIRWASAETDRLRLCAHPWPTLPHHSGAAYGYMSQRRANALPAAGPTISRFA